MRFFKSKIDDFENARHDFSRKYTFIIAPNTYGKTIKFSISAFWLKNWVLICALFAVSFALLLVSYISLLAGYTKSKEDLATLQAINKEQQLQLYDMSELSTELEDKLVYLDLLETKINTLLDEAIGTEKNLSEEDKLLIAEIDAKLIEINAKLTATTAVGGSGANPNYYIAGARIDTFDATAQVAAIKAEFVNIEASLSEDGERYQELHDTVEAIEIFSRVPDQNPLLGQKYRISSTFGYRSNPRPAFHRGIDLSGKYGTPIKAAAHGIVTYSGWFGEYGYCVIVDHQNGFQTLYGHMSKTNCSVGDEVTKADVIGYMGSTGYSTGTHLHFEILLNGVRVNPKKYITF